MDQLGHFALALAFATTLYSIVASLVGVRLSNDRLIGSGRNAGLGVFVSLTTAIFALGYLFLVSDFSIAYVAANSNRDLPLFYKISAIWGGQEGSLLLWGWILSLYSALVFIQNRRKHTAMMPYVVAVLMASSLFFTSLNLFVVNPFSEFVTVASDGTMRAFTAADGRGLNPLLQYFMMVIHPPMLYLGFVGFAVPFAFAMAAMASRQLGDTWIRTTRRWTMVSWFFLGTGIVLGGAWAYVELGWGGYWAWDPVENASLMPWLLGTAFLHSVMIQEKKGMMKVWNMILVILTYTAAIFGTFLTRSGIVSSVHAFAQSSIGGYFLAFIILILAGSLYLTFDRMSYLRTENTLESFASRESSFMLNNLLFVAACFAVLFGTMLPVLSEWVQGVKVTVAAPWFNTIMLPIGLGLLFLTGVGPLLAWRRSSPSSLRRAFLFPAIMAGAASVMLVAFGVRSVYATISLTLAVFVAGAMFQEFFKGARARGSSTGENFVEALVNLTLRNTRRYGGYIVHFGIVLIFVGFTGQAFTAEVQEEVDIGDVISLGPYDLRIEDFELSRTANYDLTRADVKLFKNGTHVANMFPEIRFYRTLEQQTHEVSIRATLQDDLYLVFAGVAPGSDQAIMQVYRNPLVSWVWIGGFVIGFGTLIALLPNKGPGPSKPGRPDHEKKADEVGQAREVHA